MKTQVVVVSDPAVLREHLAAWEDLAAAALDPNPFYEPWMVLSALRFYPPEKELIFVLIFVEEEESAGRSILCGFFPLVRQERYRGLPCIHLESWVYNLCYLCTPLVRSGYGTECMAAFFDWLKENAALLQIRRIPAEEGVYHLFVDQFRERSTLLGGWLGFTRVFIRREGDAPAKILPVQKRTVRKFRRLAETGNLEYKILDPHTDADFRQALEGFVRLEASGWKGKEGTALAAMEADRNFFLEAGVEAYRRKRFLMSALVFDGKVIAQTCYFLAGEGAYAFLTAFDEEHAKFSPGVYVMREDLNYILSPKTGIRWVDSCAWPGNTLWNGICTSRRAIQGVWFATGKSPGEFIASAWPVIRWIRRKWRGSKLDDDPA